MQTAFDVDGSVAAVLAYLMLPKWFRAQFTFATSFCIVILTSLSFVYQYLTDCSRSPAYYVCDMLNKWPLFGSFHSFSPQCNADPIIYFFTFLNKEYVHCFQIRLITNFRWALNEKKAHFLCKVRGIALHE